MADGDGPCESSPGHHARTSAVSEATDLFVNTLRSFIRDVPDFPQPGIVFRDITPLLRDHFGATVDALGEVLPAARWREIDAVAGIESRGFILAAALAARHGKGFVPIRKKGKLPPPVVERTYSLEYGSGVLEMQRGSGTLLLIDDVLATGGTLRAAADLCLDAGHVVAELAVLIDLNLVPDLRWRELPVHAVIRY
ncbi:adenine phosphoribosyltransferase [Povalibacter sp.]|uniref:adenine phosphoribosyltransferase n=1 Tax=Povalibacter sp. TaxID=1962978 RepID=UPI003FA72C62